MEIRSSTMLRRTNGKFPPLLLGGFIIAILFLAYSYWSLSIQNSDALSQIESLASRLKIEDVKMAQQEKTISTLHESLKENKGLLDSEARRESQLKDDLNAAEERIRNKVDEIGTLAATVKDLEIKLSEAEEKLSESIMEKDRLAKENFIVISQKEDAEAAVASRDEQILALERDIKTLQLKLEQGGAAEVKPAVPSVSNAGAVENNAPSGYLGSNSVLGYSQDNSRKIEPIVEEKGVLPEPLKPNEVPIVDASNPSRNEHLEAPPGDAETKNVIQPPDFDNLDTAIDEGNQFGEDPLMPDQDPDGGDLVPDNEKLLHDDRVHENRVHDDLGDEQYHHIDPDNYKKEAQMLNAENTDWDKKALDDDGGEVDAGGKVDEDVANDGDFAKENFIDDDTGGEGMGPLKLDKNFRNYDVNGEEVNREDEERVL